MANQLPRVSRQQLQQLLDRPQRQLLNHVAATQIVDLIAAKQIELLQNTRIVSDFENPLRTTARLQALNDSIDLMKGLQSLMQSLRDEEMPLSDPKETQLQLPTTV